MILVSCNNYIEYFIFKNFYINSFTTDKIEDKDVIYLLPKNIISTLKEYNKTNSLIIESPSLWASNNIFKFFGMCFFYKKFLCKLNKKYLIKKIYSFGKYTANSLLIKEVLKGKKIITLTFHKSKNNNSLKIDIYQSIILSFSYIYFLKKIILVFSSKSFTNIFLYPKTTEPEIIKFNKIKQNKLNDSKQKKEFIIIGERFYSENSAFSVKEEKSYIELLTKLSELSKKYHFKLYFYQRKGYTDKYLNPLKKTNIKIINHENLPFELFLSKLNSNKNILAVKSTCLITSMLMGHKVAQIGDLMKLNPINKKSIRDFYSSFDIHPRKIKSFENFKKIFIENH